MLISISLINKLIALKIRISDFNNKKLNIELNLIKFYIVLGILENCIGQI